MADRAKRGLWEKGGRELVALDMMDFGLFDGSSAVMQSKEAFRFKFTHVLGVCGRGEGQSEILRRLPQLGGGLGRDKDGEGISEC